MPKYKTQTNDLTEVIEAGSAGSGGLTYESVNLGNIDTSTGTFDLIPLTEQAKIFNLLSEKKIINMCIKVNNIIYRSGATTIIVSEGIELASTNLGNSAVFSISAGGLNAVTASIRLEDSYLIVANANYTLELGYDN
ncbi:MAG: hypothetical protein SOX53_03810 [Candidatus Onthovivens sp.]|nr:hypothetical protein [Candidatus Onthovivens sp.]